MGVGGLGRNSVIFGNLRLRYSLIVARSSAADRLAVSFVY